MNVLIPSVGEYLTQDSEILIEIKTGDTTNCQNKIKLTFVLVGIHN